MPIPTPFLRASVFLVLACLVLLGRTAWAVDQLAVYPALAGGQYASDRYRVQVRQGSAAAQVSPVYMTVDDYANAPAKAFMTLDDHYTNFSFSGAVVATITMPLRSTISAVEVRPAAKGVTATWSGNVITVPLAVAGNYAVIVDGEERHPLFVFANPVEVSPPPASGGAGVYYLNPGTHTTFSTTATTWYLMPGLHDIGTTGGTLQNIPSGTTVYLAGGAFVRGVLNTDASGSLTVRGRGILSGVLIPSNDTWSAANTMINSPNARLSVEGVTTVDAPQGHVLTWAPDAVIDNLKMMSWHLCTDGITVERNAQIHDCFLKVNDDGIKVTAPGITALRNTVWLQFASNAVQLGWNSQQDVSGCTVDGLDIIGCDSAAWNGTVMGHDVVSLRNIKGQGTTAGCTYSNILIANVRADVRLYQVWGMEIKDTMAGYTEGRGKVDGVTFRNWSIPLGARNPSLFDGNGTLTGEITQVTFDAVSIAGTRLTTSNAASYLTRQGNTSLFTYLSGTNHAPVASSQSVTTTAGSAKAITLGATDADGNALTYAIVANPSHGTLTGSGAARTYSPAANYSGADSFTFKANDGTVDSNTATVSITVTAVNRAPVVTTQPLNRSVAVGQTATFSVTATGTPAPTYQWQKNSVNISGATSAGYTTPATSGADNGALFRVVVSNSAGSVTSNAAVLTVTGVGWQASYYDNIDFTGALVQRTDPVIDFDWGAAAPVAGIGADTFSVRWRARVTAPTSGVWTFTATTDDGVRLWVGGKRVIDHWVGQVATATTGQVTLVAGQAVEVVMEYYDNAVSATAKLEWEGPGQPRQLVSTAVPAMGDDLPGGWTAGDLGSVLHAGSVSESGGTWTVSGSGADIWNTADGCVFARQPVVGDVRITARVDAVGTTNAWAKAGVMVRESGAAGACHAFTCLTPSSGVAYQRRVVTNGVSSHTAGPSVGAPYWVRLERVGNLLIGSCSANGTTWTEIRRETIAMQAAVLVGLAVTAHADGAVCTATFSNVDIVAAPTASN